MLLEGKVVAEAVSVRVRAQVQALAKRGLKPGLVVVLVGRDPASQVYVNSKAKKCLELGLHSAKHELPESTTQAELLKLVDQLNHDPAIHGILVQSPPPKHLDERAVIEAISPAKDVDCFHPENVGRLLIGDEGGFLPCTPAGVMEILKHYKIQTAGRHAVVLGRSNIVGKPMAVLLSRKGKYADCTVTICHSRTVDLPAMARQADILVAAIGKPEMVTADMVKPGAVVIDVGINRVADPLAKGGYRLVGDVAFAAVKDRASAITPVPGGVGPMTIAMLMQNAVLACCRQHGIKLTELNG